MEDSYIDQLEYFIYLDELRESGICNMFEAPRYLMIEYGLNREDAKSVFLNWANRYKEVG